jgi:predicted transcriptional regulator of viral defense system
MQRLKSQFADVTVLRSRELEQRGFSRVQIREAVRAGVIERIGRGLYSTPDADVTEHHSLVHVVKSIPAARICLLSALLFHDLTTQLPHEVWIAIGRKDRKPSLPYPRIRIQRFSGPALVEGVEEHVVEGVTLRVYSVAKTIVDLFRYRNKVGIDVALEALKEGWRDRRFTMAEVNRLAGLCRMTWVMTPYLQTVVA